jgi:hypothetical protein
MALVFDACYVDPTQAKDPYVSSVYATPADLAGLPPAKSTSELVRLLEDTKDPDDLFPATTAELAKRGSLASVLYIIGGR